MKNSKKIKKKFKKLIYKLNKSGLNTSKLEKEFFNLTKKKDFVSDFSGTLSGVFCR